MKQLNQLLLLGLLLVFTTSLSAQTITFEENSSEFNNRTVVLSLEGQENGRNRYANRSVGDDFADVVLRWTGTRWAITDGNDMGGANPGMAFVVYANDYDTPNPPSFDQGNWEVIFAGEELLRLEGDGTQSVNLAWNLSAGPFTTEDGVQTGLGGATPTGGTYSGPGVTDDGNGMTFSFDPAVAGVGTATITYGGEDNTVSQTIEVTQGGDMVNFSNSTGAVGTFTFAGEVNGRNSYSGSVTGSSETVTVSWSGTRWEIFASTLGVLFYSNYDVGPNPPDFATGNWQDVIGTLIQLDGDGTQAVELDFTLDNTSFTIQDGVQMGLGGGTPTGGVYFGDGVTDDGNGMTFSFNPTAAGSSMITISYGDGPDGANNVTQTVEVIDFSEVCAQEAFDGIIPSIVSIVNGQNFIACTTGRITSIDVDVLTASNTVTLKLNKGIDTEGEDYSQEVSFTETGRVRIELTEPFIVVQDSVYAFSLTDETNVFDSRGNTSNPFAGGNFFNEDGQFAEVDLNFALITEIDTSAVSTRPGLDVAVTTLTAFPNPTDGNFTVAYDLLQASDVTVVLYDAQGRKLRELPQGVQPGGAQRVNVDRSGLASGVIYYGLITERGRSAVKPVVVR